jgi:hypothetical protein
VSAWKGLFIGDGGYFLSIFRAHFSFLKWILFRRSESVFPEKKGGKLAGLYKGNIVWEHFVKGKKYFSQLIK